LSRRRNKQRQTVIDKAASRPVRTGDSFQNIMARLGANMPNMMNGTDYPLTRLTQNYNLLNSLYRNHWIVRKIVDTIPEDMCKNWIKFITQEPPEEMKKLDKVIKNTKTKERILEGLKWGRLYGGAAGVILLNRQEDMLAEPLNYDLILPGDYKGILILDRWSGISPDLELVSDLTSPDFGLPSSYRVTLQTGEALTVHHSRIIRFTGDALPAWEAWTELQWGASVIESVFDELKKRDNTSYNIANLVFLANLRVYKTNLVDLLGLGTEQMQRDFYNAMEILNWMMNNSGMSVIGKDDGFETHQYTFAGINDIYESFMLDVSGACGIPVTRLFGRSPAGFNATGESDLTNYYDAIETKQESQLAPILDKLIPIIALSTWGRIPEDIDYDFNPLRRANPKENADLSKSFGDNVVDVYNAGLISQRTALKELRQQAEVTGMWSNITDEDIEKASDKLDSLGGDMPGLEELMNPGGSSGSENPVEGENRGPFKVTEDAEWKEEDHPRDGKGKFSKTEESASGEKLTGFGAGQGDPASTCHQVKQTDKIDFSDKKAVVNRLKKAQADFDGLSYEKNCMVTPDGKVWEVSGETNSVDPEGIEKKGSNLKGSWSYHNHPADQTHYSFSEVDVKAFYQYGLAYSAASDHKYEYVMWRTEETLEVDPDVAYHRFKELYIRVLEKSWGNKNPINMDKDDYHERMNMLAEEYHFGYMRREKSAVK